MSFMLILRNNIFSHQNIICNKSNERPQVWRRTMEKEVDAQSKTLGSQDPEPVPGHASQADGGRSGAWQAAATAAWRLASYYKQALKGCGFFSDMYLWFADDWTKEFKFSYINKYV